MQPCFMLAAANGKVYEGGFKMTQKVDTSDCLLDLIIIGKGLVWKRFFICQL